MPDDNLQKLLQPSPSVFNDIVAEAVGEDFSGQRGDRHAGTLALEDVSKIFKVGVSPAHAALAELEGGNVGAAEDLVVGVHGASHAVCSRIPYLYLEKVLWWPINLVKALLPRVWHGLHNGPMQIRRFAGRLPGVLRVRQFGGGIEVDGLRDSKGCFARGISLGPRRGSC